MAWVPSPEIKREPSSPRRLGAAPPRPSLPPTGLPPHRPANRPGPGTSPRFSGAPDAQRSPAGLGGSQPPSRRHAEPGHRPHGGRGPRDSRRARPGDSRAPRSREPAGPRVQTPGGARREGRGHAVFTCCRDTGARRPAVGTGGAIGPRSPAGVAALAVPLHLARRRRRLRVPGSPASCWRAERGSTWAWSGPVPP